MIMIDNNSIGCVTLVKNPTTPQHPYAKSHPKTTSAGQNKTATLCENSEVINTGPPPKNYFRGFRSTHTQNLAISTFISSPCT
jgi:hypothetical protein